MSRYVSMGVTSGKVKKLSSVMLFCKNYGDDRFLCLDHVNLGFA